MIDSFLMNMLLMKVHCNVGKTEVYMREKVTADIFVCDNSGTAYWWSKAKCDLIHLWCFSFYDCYPAL